MFYIVYVSIDICIKRSKLENPYWRLREVITFSLSLEVMSFA